MQTRPRPTRQIRILTEEIDDLNGTLKELRSESEEDVQFMRAKVVSSPLAAGQAPH